MFNPRPKDKDKPKQENVMPVQEYRTKFLSKAGKKNKYNASKINFAGHRFDSKFEAKVFEDLEFQRLAGDLIEIKRQVKIPLIINGVKICSYYLDFKTIDKYGQVNYIEAKGFETAAWILKKKLFIALLPTIDPGATYEVIKA